MLASMMNSMTMIDVTSSASDAAITCSRLRCRRKARRSANATRGLEGRGNQDMRRKIGLAKLIRQPWGRVDVGLAVELEAQGDHGRRDDRPPVLARRLVSPVRKKMAAG